MRTLRSNCKICWLAASCFLAIQPVPQSIYLAVADEDTASDTVTDALTAAQDLQD